VWCARFTESQIETLKALIRIQGDVGSDLEGALEAMELARWDDLPEAQLPWSEVSARAELQGVSEADVVWDLSGRRKEEKAQPIKAAARKTPRKTAKGSRRSAT
jgi:hypothetical protein